MNPPIRHANYSPGVARHLLFVRHYNNRLALLMKLVEQSKNALACFTVEIAGRLVGQQNSRITDQSAGDSHTLLLTPLKLIRLMFYPVC